MLAAWAAPVVPATPATATTPAEAELGAKVAEQIEKHYKLIDDKPMLARLNDIAVTIAALSDRPDVVYTVRILDSSETNAMCIPGGMVYVTKGLLLAVESDHELAAVLAHEIAHNARYHSRRMLEKTKDHRLVNLAVIVAAVYLGRTSDVSPGGMVVMSDLVLQALENGYSQELEAEADNSAFEYLSKSARYDPLGLYSVLLGFRQMARSRPDFNPGYLKTHPDPDMRCALQEQRLKEANISINLWRVVDFRAEVLPPAEGKTEYVVKLGTATVATYAAPLGGRAPADRAADGAEAINRRLRRDFVQQYDVDIDVHDGLAQVRMRAIPILTFTQDDALAAGTTVDQLAARAAQQVKAAIWQENVKRGYSGAM
jgi:Zn-dependent protease with chaperone function